MNRLNRGIDVTRLAAEYCSAVRSSLSTSELANVRKRNDAETDAGIDHVHDFIDPADIMADCIDAQIGAGWSWCDLADVIETAQNRAKRSGYALSRVLVNCEFSATVRNAFSALGHDAVSCDLLESDDPTGKHVIGDAREQLNDGFDLMVAHPPCTYLCNSGVKHLVRSGARINPERWQDMREGAEFFLDMLTAPIDRIAVENPVMHKYAVDIIGRRQDQCIQPYDFGHDVSKRTGLWLDGLPKLQADPADYVKPRIIEYRGKTVKRWANQSPCGADKQGPSADRGHKRSVFFAGIARRMAEQWAPVSWASADEARVLAFG